MANEHPNLQIHTANIPDVENKAGRRPRFKAALSFQDRLLRNSFLACAVLLGILTLGNVQQPWAQKAAEGVRQALTMKVDLDESLGQLTFVQKMLPESAQVFFNLGGEREFLSPVQGEQSHSFDAMQPWLMYNCQDGSSVVSCADGMISAISPLSDGSWGVLVDHGSGLESVFAGLKEVKAQVGDQLPRGAEIGLSSESLFFELRENGTAIDPGEKLGL